MLRDVLNRAASGFDRAASAVLLGRSRRAREQSRSEGLGPSERVAALDHIASVWDPGAGDARLFPTPPVPTPTLNFVRKERGIRVVDALWPSAHTPFDTEIAERHLATTENRTAAARLFLHDRPGPAVILIHGYRAGRYGVEERVWPLHWFLSRGLDVALAVLPFHGVRARPFDPPRFPSSDPRLTNEALRQAMIDLRSLASYLRARGSVAVGAMGMSLGGHATSLYATVDPDLAFAVPMIPLASLADMARDGGRLVGTLEEQQQQYDGLERAHRAVSPLVRRPCIAGTRMLVLAATGDRITPIEHARRLAAHFEAPLEEFAGGHLLQFGRRDAFRAVGRLLGRLGLLT